MSILFKDYPIEFLHIPKTGGVWVEEALRVSGVKFERRGHEHGTFDRVMFERLSFDGCVPPRLGRWIFKIARKSKHPIQQPKRFCFVRNPYKWYESYWRFCRKNDWFDYGHSNDPERWHPWSDLLTVKDDDFFSFMEKVMDRFPGYLTMLYNNYTRIGVDFVGKTENLADDLVKFLTEQEVRFDDRKIASLGKKNVTRKEKDQSEWPSELRQELFKLEYAIFKKHGYHSS